MKTKRTVFIGFVVLGFVKLHDESNNYITSTNIRRPPYGKMNTIYKKGVP